MTNIWNTENRETMETVRDFIFLGFKITADGDYSHELKDTCSLEDDLSEKDNCNSSNQSLVFLKRWEYQTTLPVSWETCTWVKKQQLELDKEWWIDSKSEEE